MADKFQKRIAVQIEPPEPNLFAELPSVSDAHAIAISTEAQLGTDIPDAPTQNVVTLGNPDAVLGYDLPDAPNATVLALEARALLDANLADAPSASVVVDLPPLPDISSELASASDMARVQIPVISPELKAELADAPSAMTSVMLPALPELSSVVTDTTDVVRITTVPPLPVLSPELTDAPSASITALSPPLAVLSLELPDAPEMRRVQTPTKSPELSPEISDAPTAQVIRPAIPLPELSPEISDAPEMRRIQIPTPSPELKVELSDAPTKEVIRIAPPVPAFPAIDSIPDPGEIGQEKAREFSFNGALHLSEDPLNIKPEDYATLKNFRYKDDGIEGVGGFSRINPMAIHSSATSRYIRNAIQLKSNYTQPSYILAQHTDSSYATGKISENRGTVPNTLNFDSTEPFNIVAGDNNVIILYTILSGVQSQNVSVTMPTYNHTTGPLFALALTTQFLSYNDLTWNGLLTLTCAYNTGTYKFDITASAGTVALVYTGSTMASNLGFTGNKSSASSITSDVAVEDKSSEFYSEIAGHGLARFSSLPQGNVGMCDGKANKIYGGDERPVDAFLIGTEPTVAITSDNDRLQFVHSTEGSKAIDLTAGTYTATELAAEISDKLNTALTATVTVTNWLGKMHIAVSTGTIQYTYSAGLGYAGESCGFLADTAAATSITSQTYYAGAPFLKNLKDVTKAINSTETSLEQTVLGINAHQFFLIGATRPILKMNFTKWFTTGSPANLLVYYFDGTSFVLNTQVSDTTNDLTDPGTVTLTDTTALAQPILINGYYLYFYYCTIDSGIAYLKNATVNCPISDIIDIWGGEYLVARKALLVDDSTIKDYTLELAENAPRAYKDDGDPSNVGVMPLATMGGTTEYIELLFAFPMAGFLWDIANSSTGTTEKMIVSYWDGDSYVEAINVYDSLKNGDQVDIDGAGTVKWSNYYFGTGGGYQFFTAGTSLVPEVKSEIGNIKGYRYKVSWDDDYTGLTVDRIVGIQKYREVYDTYTFPFQYRNRAMWCGCISDSELNRVDYSQQNAPDVYNGDDSSKYDNSQSLKFGDKTALTGAVELFNQYGLNLASGALFFKNTQTFLLTGSTPTGDDPFKINKISGQIGCPAPLTITPCEVSFTTGDQPPANVVLWMTDKGPVMYYNASIYEIPGVEYFFRQENTTACLDLTYVDRAAAWYDSEYREWNLVFPSDYAVTNMGAAGLCDTWIVFDLVRRKWYQRVTANWADFPQGGFQAEDTDGNKYVYTYTASGYLMRMENGLTDGDGSTGIVNTVKTADILPLQSMWTKTYVRRMKVLHVANTGKLAITHFADGDTGAGTVVQAATVMTNAGYRYKNLIKQVYHQTNNNLLTGLSHAFSFQTTLCTAAKPKLLGHSFQFLFDREDIS